MAKGDNFSFLRKMLEKMKHAKDASSPNDPDANTKLYSLCDLALGLVMTKSSNLVLKEYPVEPALPSRLFVRAERGFVNPEFGSLPAGQPRFSPPKGAAAQRAVEHGLVPKALMKRKGQAGRRSDENAPAGRTAVKPETNRKRPPAEPPKPPSRLLPGPEESESEPEDVVRFTPTKKRRVDSPAKLKPRAESPAKTPTTAASVKASAAAMKATGAAKVAAATKATSVTKAPAVSAKSPATSAKSTVANAVASKSPGRATGAKSPAAEKQK